MSTAFKYRRLSKDDAAVLLVDHQSGLISLVQDYSPGEFQNNVPALADIAKYYQLPTILTTSFEDGPNGPLGPSSKLVVRIVGSWQYLAMSARARTLFCNSPGE